MHISAVKGKHILSVIAILLVAVLLSISIDGTTSAQVYFGYAPRRVPIYQVDTEEKQVAISFDAAWGSEKTEGILEILDEFDVTATFFLVGFWVDKNPEMVKKIAESGNEIGTHSNTHPDMTKLDKETISLELSTSVEKIESITGKTVKLFRAPYGYYNNTVLDTATSLGLTTIQWSIDTLDWKGGSASEICNKVVSKLQNGAIILMHNDSDHVLDGLRLVLTTLKNKGYSVTSISELIYESNYTIDANGIQHKNN